MIERRCLGAEFDVDGLARDFIGPLEIRAVPLRRITVAGARWFAALHHSLQDGALQEIVQLVEFLSGLEEALVGGAEGRTGYLA